MLSFLLAAALSDGAYTNARVVARAPPFAVVQAAAPAGNQALVGVLLQKGAAPLSISIDDQSIGDAAVRVRTAPWGRKGLYDVDIELRTPYAPMTRLHYFVQLRNEGTADAALEIVCAFGGNKAALSALSGAAIRLAGRCGKSRDRA